MYVLTAPLYAHILCILYIYICVYIYHIIYHIQCGLINILNRLLAITHAQRHPKYIIVSHLIT